ncbi:MAG: hypothetical protein HC789_11500 [Microcoleus sp. CSU_2_2]|nr:hypothetical protein [Microcoleus sp. SU_5_3]NJS10939.1 hypothetical protein [Microcoleus sp. CSU_2_2]
MGESSFVGCIAFAVADCGDFIAQTVSPCIVSLKWRAIALTVPVASVLNALLLCALNFAEPQPPLHPQPLPTYQPQPTAFMQNTDRLLQSFTNTRQFWVSSIVRVEIQHFSGM